MVRPFGSVQSILSTCSASEPGEGRRDFGDELRSRPQVRLAEAEPCVAPGRWRTGPATIVYGREKRAGRCERRSVEGQSPAV